MMNTPFSVMRAEQIQSQALTQPPWLIDALWSRSAVGFLAGPPKSCKSWLGLDMAVSVASATPCLDRFAVGQPGPALIYMAEDALPGVRDRIQGICSHRNIELAGLDLYVIDAPSIQLERTEDQQQLTQAIENLRPALLLLDPLVRLHGLDENSSQEMARLLGFLRHLQRSFDIAVVLVHHTGKKTHGHTGYALRGSSDLHAWTDSAAFLSRKHDSLRLRLEHRSAPAPQPLWLQLVTNGYTHLEITATSPSSTSEPVSDLQQAIAALLACKNEPLTRAKIRDALKVRNQTLGDALTAMQSAGLIRKNHAGWEPVHAHPP